MCSIIGYCGEQAAAPIIVRGLKRMEYRGYDSVGVATESSSKISLRKGIGRVEQVNGRMQLDRLQGRVGIGHTRWATHGAVTNLNAHPHQSSSGKIAIVHNGVLENFEEIKEQLQGEGYSFKSDTDSEVIANMLQKHYMATQSVKEAVLKTVSEIKGHYAFVAVFEGGQMAAARLHEPLIVGVGKKNGEYFLSSDVLGFIEYTDNAVYVENRNLVILDGGDSDNEDGSDGFSILDFQGKSVRYETTKISKEFGDTSKGEYAHFTLKEIYEQPDTVLKAGNRTQEAIKESARLIKGAKNIYVTGSGTSYNAALVAKQALSSYAKIKAEPIISSELQFLSESIEENSAIVAISQSGESADVLDAVRIAKQANCKVIAVVNVLTSTLARQADLVIGMDCGPEIGVAATKSFTAQLCIIYKIVQELTDGKTTVNFDEISEAVSKMLGESARIQEVARELKGVSDIYVLGRGMNYPIAAEAALKLKELTYIHAEGIPGGELKHGPLAVVNSSVFVIAINPEDPTYSDMLTSVREIKARNAKIIGVSDIKSDVYDFWIEIPALKNMAAYPISEVVSMQLLSYYAALENDADPDHPRNLAKSVTVK